LKSIPASHRRDRVAAVASSLGLCFLGPAWADPPPASAPAPGTAPTITIEAQRQREQLRTEANRFVQATIARPRTADSLLRWDSAVCPLVAGLPRGQGEFVLGRLSAIARGANVPLAGERCAPNLYVIVTSNPRRFLSLWWDHDPRLFSTRHGIGGIQHFIETDSPVRVWYDVMAVDADLSSEIQTMLAQTMGVGPNGAQQTYPTNRSQALGSRLTYVDVRAIAWAIVVIDAQKLAKLNLGQLTDYVSLRSFVEIKPDTDAGGAPSILNLFSDQEGSPPPGLTAWDQALLHAVYSTKQKDQMQLSEIQTATFNQLVAVSAK
jgi:hypothetical protein